VWTHSCSCQRAALLELLGPSKPPTNSVAAGWRSLSWRPGDQATARCAAGGGISTRMTMHRLRGARNGAPGMLSACLSLVIAASVGLGCPPGYAMDNHGQCRQCAPGTYKPMEGTSSCLMCPYATFSNVTGASSAGMCTSCPLWHFADQGSRDATSCIAPLASNNANNRTPLELPVCMPGRVSLPASPDCLTDQGRHSRKSAARNLVPKKFGRI